MIKKSKKEFIYEELKNEIILGTLQPRDRIIELAIAEKFNSSQAPIREALLKLQEDGLVELIPFTVAFVSEISFDEIKELFEYRRIIELNDLKNGIYLLTTQDFLSLEKIIIDMKEAGKQKELSTLISCEMLFHRKVIEKAQRKMSLNIWKKLDIHISRFIASVHSKYFEDLEEIALKHEPLLHVLKQKNLDEAKKIFSEHLNVEPIIQKIT
ncbi:GntR family transcriptional regulator [Bacillaceae bacterium IKA-2]|nr:GntR family transcriptional regulator [Bacillaceae bacterium IKA-2]